MAKLSLAHARALSDRGDNEEALLIIRSLAAAGEPDALALLAELTWRGGMVAQEPRRGRLLYEYAARLGHRGAGLFVTNLLASGIAGQRDWQEALKRLSCEAKVDRASELAVRLVERMDIDEAGDPISIPEPQPLAERPHAQVFAGLLTADECAYLIDAADPRFEPSMIVDEQRRPVRDPLRTSDGAAFHWLVEDPVVHAINRRIAAASGTRYEQGEPLQVLRYAPGQQYHPHFDYVAGAANRRVWTALIYLNDDYGGGETEFVRTGLKFRGKAGDVLLFGNAGPDGGPDPFSEHAGRPVTYRTKYLATRWVRERPVVP